MKALFEILFLKILFFIPANFQSNISEAKVVVFDDAVSKIKFSIDNVENKFAYRK